MTKNVAKAALSFSYTHSKLFVQSRRNSKQIEDNWNLQSLDNRQANSNGVLMWRLGFSDSYDN